MSFSSITSDTLDRLSGGRLVPPSLVAIVIFLAIWQFISLSFDQTVLPGIGRVVANIISVLTGEDQFDLLDNLIPSVIRIAFGFAFSMIIGTALGIGMGTSDRFEEYLTAPIMAFLTFPAVVWAFMAILWLGVTKFTVHILVITLVVTPAVTVNIWKGAESVDRELVEMAEAFDASSLSNWRHIYIPHLQPFLYSSARQAFALSWKISLVSEVFGATSGIGYVVSYYFQTLRADMIIAWVIPVMFLMFLVERLFKRLEERSFAWRPELETNIEQAQ